MNHLVFISDELNADKLTLRLKRTTFSEKNTWELNLHCVVASF